MNDDRGARDEDIAESGDSRWPGSPDSGPGVSVVGGGASWPSPGEAAGGPAREGEGTAAGGRAGTEAGGAGDGPGPSGDGGPEGSRRAKQGKSRSWWIELPVLFGFALVLALLIKTFVVQAFFIPSSSMENTLEIGDKVLVNKLVYDFRPIHRGDIVVFNGDGSWDPNPVQPKPPLVRLWDSITGLFGTAPGVHDYIKRVIGVPGDHVACCDAKGRVTVNGVPLNETGRQGYLYPGNAPSSVPFRITVPPGRLWVMGDHRAVSYDSRGHMSDPGNGTIPESHVVGRAFLIIAPVHRWRVLPIPATFEQPRLAAQAAAGPVVVSGPVGAAGAAAPLAFGLLGAVPLTWGERRLRRRLGRSRRRG